MRAKDVMTRAVVTVAPSASVRELAELLCEHRISGVPVVSDHKVVGMVTEGDLLRRQEIGTERLERSWWTRVFATHRGSADYVRSHARRAADIMSQPVITTAEDTPVAEIVSLFEAHRIRRVPVTRNGKLVGLVSRADLVHALASKARRSTAQVAADDKAIRERLLDELEHQPWWQRYSSMLTVSAGVVHYWGVLDSEDEKRAARVAAENIPGVHEVVDHRQYFNSMNSML
jgi:CBS domain-containing protein